MRIVFLDIDGVLTRPSVHVAYRDKGVWNRASPVATRLLDRLCRDAGALVVICSAWRKIHTRLEIEHTLRRGGFRGALHEDWCTGVDEEGIRGDEVRAWLAAHPEVTAHVVIDDEPDRYHPDQPVVATVPEAGLVYSGFQAAYRHLTGAGWTPRR